MEAVIEVMRDYAHTLPRVLPMPQTALHYGFSVICDGVRWQLLRMSVSSNSSLHYVSSNAFEFCTFDEEKKTTTLNEGTARAFFELVVLATLLRRRWTYTFDWTLPDALTKASCRLTELVSANQDGCIVLRYTCDGRRRLAKFAEPDNDIGSRRLSNEIAARAALTAALQARGIDEQVCVAVANDMEVSGHRALVFDDSDGALSVSDWLLSAPLSPSERESLARLVLDHVGKALDAIHSVDFTFVDIHPGNVVVARGATSEWLWARLVDCEWLCRVGTPLSDHRVLLRKEIAPAKYVEMVGAETELAGDTTSLRLVLAWILDVEAFRTAVLSTAKSGDSNEGVKQWSNKKAAVLKRIDKWINKQTS